MTKILILGGGGMIGQKLAKQLLANDPDADITLHDIAFPPNGVPATQQTGDVSDPATMTAIAQAKFDTIYHLASIVSGEAEQQFRKGWVTNLHAMMNLLEGLRTVEHCPRIVFTSSIAVFGGPYPDVITDDYFQSPQAMAHKSLHAKSYSKIIPVKAMSTDYRYVCLQSVCAQANQTLQHRHSFQASSGNL
jgi:nucleoside-diphosphate-sugar epimerase